MTKVAGVGEAQPTRERAAPGAVLPRRSATPVHIVQDVGSTREQRSTRAVLGVAIVAVCILVLLMPATPLVGFVLIAAVTLGAVALAVRHAELRRSEPTTLAQLGERGYSILADRHSPALTGVIDRLIIGPGGVFLIEVRDLPGHARIRGDQLVINGHTYDVGSQLRAQVAAVATTLAPVLDGSGATVVPLIWMRSAELPVLRREVGGVPILREAQLVQRITSSHTVLGTGSVVRLAELIDRTMPPTGRRRGPVRTPTAADTPPAMGAAAHANGG